MADSPPLRSAPKLLLILKSTAAGERVAVSPIDELALMPRSDAQRE